MAFPVNARQTADSPQQTGIRLVIGLSSDRTLAVELQRMTTASTWATVDVLPGAALSLTNHVWTDLAPVDRQTRSYRARNTFPGMWPSAWTATVAARPWPLGTRTPAPLALTGQGVGASIHVQDPTNTITIGTAQASTYVTKQVTFAAVDFQAGDGSTAVIYMLSQGRVYAANNNLWTLWRGLELPYGCTIRRVRMEGRRTTGATCTAYLRNFGVNLTVFTAATGAAGSTSYAVTASSMMSLVASSAQGLSLEVQLWNNSATGTDRASFRRVFVEYSMPSYDKGI